MPPEQAAGARDVDDKADVFSLGLLLYELLTGEPAVKSNEHPLSTYATKVELPLFAGSEDLLCSLICEMTKRIPARRPTMKQVHERLLAITSAATTPPCFTTLSIKDISQVFGRRREDTLPPAGSPSAAAPALAAAHALQAAGTAVAYHAAPAAERYVDERAAIRSERVCESASVDHAFVRDALGQEFPTVSDFDAFFCDYFHMLYRKLPSGMNLQDRMTALLSSFPPAHIYQTLQIFQSRIRN